MDWAINSAGDHVKAGASGASGYSLRCPVCKAKVYHRQGSYNRPHFAHYSGNFDRACELYSPGTGGFAGPRSATSALLTPPSRESPVLVWLDREFVALSLHLRLPRVPSGYASTLRISSLLGVRPYSGEELTRTSFVRLPLNEPPAEVTTSPKDPAAEMWVEEALRQFRLSGNYFRATSTGGVLERTDAALELGEDYFLVTQRPLLAPHPPALVHSRPSRQLGSWMVYHLHLRDDPNIHDDDIADLRSYLGRSIVPPKHRISVIWPTPLRFDVDGALVFADSTSQVVVRSNAGPPSLEADDLATISISDLGHGLYQVNLGNPGGEVALWASSGSVQRIRRQAESFTSPTGVLISSGTRTCDIASPEAVKVADKAESVGVSVPSELLWRIAKVDGRKLRPLPSGALSSLEGPVQSIDFGAFGSVLIPHVLAINGSLLTPWYASVERAVFASAGMVASARLRTLLSKQQCVRWAIENKALHILPLVLSAFKVEVDRGIS